MLPPDAGPGSVTRLVTRCDRVATGGDNRKQRTICDQLVVARAYRCSYVCQGDRLTFRGRHSGVAGGVPAGLLLGCGQDRDGPLEVERKLLLGHAQQVR
jgi:hypothetical protein